MADLPARLVLSLTPIGPQVGSADTGVGNVNDGVRWLKNSRIRNLLDLYIKSSSKNGCFHMPTRSTDRGDRAQDHLRDDLGPRDHDHMGAFHLGDRGPAATESPGRTRPMHSRHALWDWSGAR